MSVGLTSVAVTDLVQVLVKTRYVMPSGPDSLIL